MVIAHRLLALLVLWGSLSVSLRAAVSLKSGDFLVFHGNSLVERLLEQGELQALVHLADPSRTVHVRSFAWTGDEVGHRLRAEGYADHLQWLIQLWPARVVVLGYGMNESFGGTNGLPEFRSQLEVLLGQLSRVHSGAQFVLLSPTAVEAGHPGPDPAQRNRDLALYSAALEEAARKHGALFVNLFTASQQAYAARSGRLTVDGLHLNEAGNRAMAREIAAALLGASAVQEVNAARVPEVAAASAQLAHAVSEVVRPKNGILDYGQRKRADEREAEMPLR
jgi:lysophospholipase L1-like esterase